MRAFTRIVPRIAVIMLGVVPLLAGSALEAEQTRPNRSRPARADIADTAAGTYYGDVISDSRGSSRSGVTITVTKVGPGQVSVSSSYRRLPTFNVRLTRAMHTIQQASGDNVFLLDTSKSPAGLDVTVDGASWSGEKRGSAQP